MYIRSGTQHKTEVYNVRPVATEKHNRTIWRSRQDILA